MEGQQPRPDLFAGRKHRETSFGPWPGGTAFSRRQGASASSDYTKSNAACNATCLYGIPLGFYWATVFALIFQSDHHDVGGIMFKNARSASLLSTVAESDRSQARAEKPGSLTQPRGCHRIRIALAAFLLLVIRLLLLCGLSLPTHAQVAGGTLSGKITDPSGAAIALAEVEIKNVATGVSSKVSTNDNGFYSATNLLSGEYRVTVSAQGFNTAVEKTGINLTVGAHQTFDLTLQIGTRTDIVEVMTESLAMQLSSSD